MNSPSVKLRQFQLVDAPEVAQLVGDQDVSRWTSNIPHPYSEQDAIDWITEMESSERRPFAVELEGQLVASVSFWPHESGGVEVGYWVGKAFWGRGVGTAALNTLLNHRDFPRNTDVYARIMIDNIGSKRVLEKSGFSFLKPGGCPKNGCEVPAHIYVRKSSLGQDTYS